jgi:solute carrier family 25 folate transporter 32
MDRSTLSSSIAGFAAGASSIVFFPLEMLKVHLAVSEVQSRNFLPHYPSPLQVAKSIYSKEGVRGFFKGCHFNLFSSLAWSSYFFFYARALNQYSADFKQHHSELYKFASAAEAAVLSRLLTNPMWVVKTRVMLNHNYTNWLASTVETTRKIYKVDGLKGFWSGLVPGLLLCSNGTFQMYFYEVLKALSSSQQDLLTTSVIGSSSKLLSTVFLYPLQLVMLRLQQEQHTSYILKNSAEITEPVKGPKLFDGMLQCFKSTVAKEGVRGLYRGLGVNLVRQLPASALFFVTYEHTYHYMHSLGL